ncbi:insulinase family protein [Peptoniphilus raoultii]|uniref:insulinase family protein n=1 Tax=Peptoniphilus raoultii TaxID=1776387 RepID=UPI0008D98836|nr:insulinase family protein [Peptoniphilus raoultii]
MENYKLIEEKYIDEVASLCTVYEHIKTGAKVLTLKNKDNNKAFGIGFRTPPEFGNGAAHIVEHCVLSGSRKYRTKEPFMDLIKSSLQTFLNAMTYPDKTIYPISSRNQKDFENLMDVYLDAVFYPRIYEEKKIFMQEGWHYEIDEKTGELKYNGVVYNEMKGVYSQVENIVSDAFIFNLHENSSYGVDSGGDPKLIPTLSYGEFLDFHKKYYHPSNSYIYLYGDIDMEERLNFIDENYLSNFIREEVNSGIILNKPLERQKRAEVTFSASKDELSENKDFLLYGWCLGESLNKKDAFMRDFLSELLIDAEGAPLKRALLDINFGEDVYSETSTSKTLDLALVLKNTDGNKIEEFKEIIENTLRKLIKEGINKKLLLATLSRFEFNYREGGGIQKAIIYYTRAMNSWLYDRSPFDSLEFNDVIKEIKAGLDEGFVEKYIEEKLLNNKYSIILKAFQELDKNLKEENELKIKLKEFKESLSPEKIEEIKENQKVLFDYQLSDDSEEDKKTIPSLKLEDISKGITKYDYEEDKIGDTLFIKAREATNNIIYITLSHNIDFLNEREIKNFPILLALIGNMSTESYSYEDLDNEIYIKTGGISFNSSAYQKENSKNFARRLNIKMKTLKENFGSGLELIKEIIGKTKLDDKKRAKEVLLILKSQTQAGLLQGGAQVVMGLTKSYYSALGKYNSITNGMDYYFYLTEILKDFDQNWDKILRDLKNLYKKIFNKNDLIISATGGEESLQKIKKDLEDYINSLAREKYEAEKFNFQRENKNEGIYTSSNVCFISKGYNLSDLGENYRGDLQVLGNILSSQYLHTEIRAKGGAYGAGISFSRYGDMVTYSYRDPNVENTIDVYNRIPEFIRNLNLTEDGLKNFIIGSMNAFDPLLTVSVIDELNLAKKLTNVWDGDIIKNKDEALSTNLEKLKSYADVIEKALAENYISALGSEEKLKENQKFLKDLRPLN